MDFHIFHVFSQQQGHIRQWEYHIWNQGKILHLLMSTITLKPAQELTIFPLRIYFV